ncbi:DUF294 nucleotidyltransferase-like domain-containing protein [Bradyrhizobium sp.]|uniref:DUF294 nucleotidyltransferase-like domain-containing protein n=1 Tax=Bradyrhizobium sp. TaxID=376 RepID=UPI004037B6D5
MDRTLGGAPLLGLDAVVIDTETTGLDPRKSRVIELAAVRLEAGQLVDGDSFRQLIRPGDEAIPGGVTKIHGIDDTAVAGAPTFAQVWPRFLEYLGARIVIGHTIGFDLAVWKRECQLAGLPWQRPRTLDTRLLAQIAAPELAGYALEKVAIWLGVEILDRHTALGDAAISAKVFRALVPKLRDHGIRTVAEAERACHALTALLDDQTRLGWVEAVEPPSRVDAERTLRRLDAYAFRRRIRDIMRAPVIFVAPDIRVREVVTRMAGEKISAVYVGGLHAATHGIKAVDAGILTERDVLRAIDRHGAAALELPAERIMASPLISVSADAFLYRAIGRMSRRRIRHLGVIDEGGRIVGALSARDLLRSRAGAAVSLDDEIEDATDAHGLAAAWAKLPHLAASLLEEGLSGREIAEVISRELGELTRQAAVIAEQIMQRHGHGEPPVPYALVVLGSAGRGESLLAMDQDNAVIFERGAPDGPEDRWFAAFGEHVADILHEAGVPYCKGGVMAKNAAWRGSLATWQGRVEHWISRSSPADLLSVDIFFDLRAVHGDGALAVAVRQAAYDAAEGQAAFAKLLVDTVRIPASLGWFGGIRSEGGRIDLKAAGLFGLVAAARAIALRYHVMDRSTPARLAGVKALVNASQSDLDALMEAQNIFLDLILAQQVEDVGHGLPPSNAVMLKQLSPRAREQLRTALNAVAHVDDLARDLLFRN